MFSFSDARPFFTFFDFRSFLGKLPPSSLIDSTIEDPCSIVVVEEEDVDDTTVVIVFLVVADRIAASLDTILKDWIVCISK